MTIVISSCLCCGAPYVNGSYMCGCRQDAHADCCSVEGWIYCKVCCPVHNLKEVHPLDLPLAQVWQEAVKGEGD